MAAGPLKTTTTASTFVPPEGITAGTPPPPPGILPAAGTGALPIFVTLSLTGTAVAAAIVGFRLWRTRPVRPDGSASASG